jgi:hypothetical protein
MTFILGRREYMIVRIRVVDHTEVSAVTLLHTESYVLQLTEHKTAHKQINMLKFSYFCELEEHTGEQ